MTPEKLTALEAYTEQLENVNALHEYLKEVASALREAWQEQAVLLEQRDQARQTIADYRNSVDKWRAHCSGIAKERDEAREDYRRQKQEALDAFAAVFAAQKERNEACELLAKLYERFACAKCVAPKPEPKDPCPCGYAEIRNYLDKVMP